MSGGLVTASLYYCFTTPSPVVQVSSGEKAAWHEAKNIKAVEGNRGEEESGQGMSKVIVLG